jgi:hypothetical protein
MNFSFDTSAQTNTVLSVNGTRYTYANSNDLSTKQNLLDASTNLLGIGTSLSALNYNNITLNKPNLNLYAIKSNVDGSFNTLSTSVSTKENALTFTTPLTRTTNTKGIDLSAYPLKTYVDGSLNTLNSTLSNKQK